MSNQILSMHIKCYKSNYFFIISNNSGKVIFIKNSGNLGFRNMQKRGVEALSMLLETCLKEIIFLKKNYFFLKIEGLKLNVLKIIYKHLIFFFKKNKIVLIGFKHIHKNSHNGCRRKK
jgi:hypothetical protein